MTAYNYGYYGNYNANYGETYYAQPSETYTKLEEIKIEDCYKKLKDLLVSKPIESLVFTPYAWAKIMSYIHIVGDYEITGFGKIENGFITDIRILKQTVEKAYVDCSEDSMLEFLQSIPRDEIGLWCLDWHSHVNMNTSPSITDTNNYAVMSKLRLGEPFPVLIINKSESMYGATYFSSGITKHTRITKPAENVDLKTLKEVYSQCEQDILALCNIRTTYYKNNSTLLTQNYKHANINNVGNKTGGDTKKEEVVENEIMNVSMTTTCKSCGAEKLYQDATKCNICGEPYTDFNDEIILQCRFCGNELTEDFEIQECLCQECLLEDYQYDNLQSENV